MENKDLVISKEDSYKFNELLMKAKNGNKNSMEEIITLFKDDIENLSKFIALPNDESIQLLKEQLISIVLEQL